LNPDDSIEIGILPGRPPDGLTELPWLEPKAIRQSCMRLMYQFWDVSTCENNVRDRIIDGCWPESNQEFKPSYKKAVSNEKTTIDFKADRRCIGRYRVRYPVKACPVSRRATGR